jgi:hypothetical protein
MWTVLHLAEPGASGKRRWVCKCDCGTEKAVLQISLVNGDSKSCSRSGHKLPATTPGYMTWALLIQRCMNPKDKAYPRYGGRGITVCQRWLDSFANFHSDMGDRPDGKTLDRIDNDGPYSPENCRWATASEQANNTRRNLLVEHQGEVLTVAQLAQRTGVKYGTLRSRVRRGSKLLEA